MKALALTLTLLWASTASAQWEVICQSKGKIDGIKIDGIYVHVVVDSSGNVVVDSSRYVADDSCVLAMKAQPVFFNADGFSFNELTDDEFNELLNKASKLEIDGLPKFDVNMEGSK